MLALDSERTFLSFSTAFCSLLSLPFPLDIGAVKGGLLYLEIDQKRNIKIIFTICIIIIMIHLFLYALCPNV